MGVDLSIQVEVGFVFDEKDFESYLQQKDFEDFGEYEVLERLLKHEPLLGFGIAGSFYDTKPNKYWVSVSRLSSGGSSYDLDGGVYGVERPVITLAEREALQRVAFELGVPFTDAYQFVSVLWH